MKNICEVMNNERGSVVFITLLILSLMTILGLAANKTTVTEMRISSNQTINKQNFYNAEAATNEGMQIAEDTDLENNMPAWILPIDSGVLDSEDPASEIADLYNDATWKDFSLPSGPIGTAEYMSANRGIARGHSLGVDGSTVHAFDFYGRDRSNGGRAIIKMAYRKAY